MLLIQLLQFDVSHSPQGGSRPWGGMSHTTLYPSLSLTRPSLVQLSMINIATGFLAPTKHFFITLVTELDKFHKKKNNFQNGTCQIQSAAADGKNFPQVTQKGMKSNNPKSASYLAKKWMVRRKTVKRKGIRTVRAAHCSAVPLPSPVPAWGPLSTTVKNSSLRNPPPPLPSSIISQLGERWLPIATGHPFWQLQRGFQLLQMFVRSLQQSAKGAVCIPSLIALTTV